MVLFIKYLSPSVSYHTFKKLRFETLSFLPNNIITLPFSFFSFDKVLTLSDIILDDNETLCYGFEIKNNCLTEHFYFDANINHFSIEHPLNSDEIEFFIKTTFEFFGVLSFGYDNESTFQSELFSKIKDILANAATIENVISDSYSFFEETIFVELTETSDKNKFRFDVFDGGLCTFSKFHNLHHIDETACSLNFRTDLLKYKPQNEFISSVLKEHFDYWKTTF